MCRQFARTAVPALRAAAAIISPRGDGRGHAIKEAVAVRRVSRRERKRERERERREQPSRACQEVGDACRCACGWRVGTGRTDRLTPCPAGLAP